jgi:hypothetical protein
MQRSVHLDQVAITSPCSVPWETMPGDERVRFCGQCRQDVYNIAGLTRLEAQRLVADRQGRLCARILRRPDGTVVTADCWSRLRAARRRGIVHLVAVLLVVVVPELFAMRFGLTNLFKLAGLGPAPAPVPAITLPPAPSFPEDVMVGGIGSDEDAVETELSLGAIRLD